MDRIIETIKKGGSYILLPHVNADGDSISSCFALREMIKAAGGKARVVLEEKISEGLSFLGDDYEVFLPDGNYAADVTVAVDCADYERLGKRSAIFEKASVTWCIDHHVTNKSRFADIEVVNPKAAATAEVVYEIAKEGGMPITRETADYMYTGLVTDTGSFRYSNTTEKTLLAAAHLVALGADNARICTEVFENKRLSQLKIEAAAVARTELFYGGQLAVVIIDENMLKEAQAVYEDADTVSGILRGIRGVKVSAVIKEKMGKSKVSMRSKGIDISGVCSALGGGGHLYAAGAEVDMPPEDCRKLLLETFEKMLVSAFK